MKTKRVLIAVKANSWGKRWAEQMNVAVNAILAAGFYADMWSCSFGNQRIYDADGNVMAECKSAKFLPKTGGNCPPEFVMELPAHLVRKGVPTYMGKIK